MKKENFSLRHTQIIKGIAALMLIGFHCFSSISRLQGYKVDFGFLSQDTAFKFFEGMVICVGIFVFLSSYGLTKSYLKESKKGTGNFVLKKILKLLSSYFIVALICIIVSFIYMGRNPYGTGLNFICNLIADLLGLGGFLNTPMMVGTWWYMSFALLIIILIPITIKLNEKYGMYVFLPYILPGVFNISFFSEQALHKMVVWLLLIPVGVVFARYNLMEKIKEKKICENKYLNKVIKFIFMTILLVFLFYFRDTVWSTTHFHYFICAILPTYFVVYSYEFIVDIPILKKILAYIGKHSMHIFLIHTFIRGSWFVDFTYSLGHVVSIFIFVLLASLIISIMINFIKKIIRYEKFVSYLSLKIDKKLH